MVKRQASHMFAATIASALFFSLSAHAGLLGAGGVATGTIGAGGGIVGGATGRLGGATLMPMNPPMRNSTAANAANGVDRVDRNGALAGQAGAMLAGQSTAGQAVAVPGDDIGQQAERLTRRGSATGNMVVDGMGDARGQATGQALQIRQANEANANTLITAGRGEAAELGAQASDVAATASRMPQASARGSVSGSGSAQASNGNASVAGNGSASASGSVSN